MSTSFRIAVASIAIIVSTSNNAVLGELTEHDIIQKEILWAKRAVTHYQHGFYHLYDETIGAAVPTKRLQHDSTVAVSKQRQQQQQDSNNNRTRKRRQSFDADTLVNNNNITSWYEMLAYIPLSIPEPSLSSITPAPLPTPTTSHYGIHHEDDYTNMEYDSIRERTNRIYHDNDNIRENKNIQYDDDNHNNNYDYNVHEKVHLYTDDGVDQNAPRYSHSNNRKYPNENNDDTDTLSFDVTRRNTSYRKEYRVTTNDYSQ